MRPCSRMRRPLPRCPSSWRTPTWLPSRHRPRSWRDTDPTLLASRSGSAHSVTVPGGPAEPAEMALNPRRNPLNLIRVMPAKGRKAMAEYIRVLWKHDSPDEPIEMHYEVLEDRAVVRMVERVIDGHANADTIEW